MKRARKAIAESIGDDMVASLCRDTLVATGVDGPAPFQQQEQQVPRARRRPPALQAPILTIAGLKADASRAQVLSVVHAALHVVLASARRP